VGLLQRVLRRAAPTLRGESSPGTVLLVDDAELLESLLGGNESAFAELVRRYHPTLVKVARYYVANAASAEDVAQDTWIAVIKGAEKFEGRSAFKTWLLRICVNRARTTGVKEHRSIPVDPNESGPSVSAHRFDQGGFWSDPPVPFTDAVDDRLDNSVLLGAVRDAIDTLGEPQQAVVTLRDVEGLSTQEVATLLGLSEANVRVILHRGRARVRAIVEEAMKGSRI
jgi:RNA polymerase sigma-70 factor, ECF subfamily